MEILDILSLVVVTGLPVTCWPPVLEITERAIVYFDDHNDQNKVMVGQMELLYRKKVFTKVVILFKDYHYVERLVITCTFSSVNLMIIIIIIIFKNKIIILDIIKL